MPAIVSPGVYLNVIDASLYGQFVSPMLAGIVITSTRGPLNQVVECSNFNAFARTFGPTSRNHIGTYAARQFYRQGNRLKVVRVAGPAAAQASVALQSGGQTSITVTAIDKGTYGNNVSVQILDGTTSGTKKMIITYQGTSLRYDNLVKTDTSPNYFLTRVNGKDPNVVLTDHPSVPGLPDNGTFQLTGGDDGLSNITDSHYIGQITGTTVTGLQLFLDLDSVDVDVVAVPGVSSPNVVVSLIALAETRTDCMAIVDPPLGLNSVQDIVDWHNGEGSFTDHGAFNSRYAALYWPWILVPADDAGEPLYIPPSAAALERWAYTDQYFDPWFAPAGSTRGKVTGVLNVEYSPSKPDRDLMEGEGSGNAVNPIVNFHIDGIQIYGQRTLQRSDTALNRINVIRMIIALQRTLTRSFKPLVFEPNDASTWQQFLNTAGPIIDTVVKRRGIREFRLIMDDTTNTDEIIERNEMRGKLFIKPTKTAEMIVLDVTVTGQSVVLSTLQ